MKPPDIRVNIRELRVAGIKARDAGRFQRELVHAVRARLGAAAAARQGTSDAVSRIAQQAAQRIAAVVKTGGGER
jgi:hypothetical protein